MAKSNVKCVYCQQIFDRNNEPYEKVGARYAHKKCYDLYYTDEDFYKDKIYEVIKEVFGPKYNYVKIDKQRRDFNAAGINNRIIYETLYYYYIVRENSKEKANGGIGIVPYILNEAKSYFKEKEEAKSRANEALSPVEIKVDIDLLKRKTTLKRDIINLSDLE